MTTRNTRHDATQAHDQPVIQWTAIGYRYDASDAWDGPSRPLFRFYAPAVERVALSVAQELGHRGQLTPGWTEDVRAVVAR